MRGACDQFLRACLRVCLARQRIKPKLQTCLFRFRQMDHRRCPKPDVCKGTHDGLCFAKSKAAGGKSQKPIVEVFPRQGAMRHTGGHHCHTAGTRQRLKTVLHLEPAIAHEDQPMFGIHGNGRRMGSDTGFMNDITGGMRRIGRLGCRHAKFPKIIRSADIIQIHALKQCGQRGYVEAMIRQAVAGNQMTQAVAMDRLAALMEGVQ